MAESFGLDPERYDRTRPRYPQAMVEAIIASSPGRDVLDVGIGTGVAARAFRAAGCRVLGVDPDPRMADFARQSGLEVEVAKFETWDPKGRRFATVIAGQTWHWVDPVAGTAKAGEVLQPEGRLAVFWNVFQPEPDLREAFTAVYRRVLPDLPFFGGTPRGLEAYSGQAAKATDGIRPRRGASVNPSSGDSTGSAHIPRRVAGPGTHVRRPQSTTTCQVRRAADGNWSRSRRGGRPVDDGICRGSGDRGAKGWSLTLGTRLR